ncbi:MAG TPA: hypothetical protein VGQ39_19960 [Pyrinomonadaceae bacterium]|jgi:hypothetical protein|nr:hypothetical protein [Pyrinomonadaceae bacterium]
MEKLDTAFYKALDTAVTHAVSHLEKLSQDSVAATVSADTLRSRLAKKLNDDPLSPELVVDELAQDVEGGLLGSAGGRFFGWVIGGVLPAALASDWMTSAWQQNAALYAKSPAAAVVLR